MGSRGSRRGFSFHPHSFSFIMAIIKNSVMGSFQGQVGTLTTYQAAAGNVARTRFNATNTGESASRTILQQNNRVRWANLVNLYKSSQQWMIKAFESKKKAHSDYNQLMSVNFDTSSIALTKSQAASGACVVDGYVVSQGSLPSVVVTPFEEVFVTNIRLGSFEPEDTSTVAQLSTALVKNNNYLHDGMQLSFISYQQIIDEMGVPRVICTPYEMRINTKDTTRLAWDFLPEFACRMSGGFLCTGENISVGAFCYVLSDSRRGRTRVSSQRLVTNNAELITRFSSDEQILAAVESYGISTKGFLDSADASETPATPQPNFISQLFASDGIRYVPGDYNVSLGKLIGGQTGNQVKVFFGNPLTAETISRVWVTLGSGTELTLLVRGQGAKEVRAYVASSDMQYLSEFVVSVNVLDGEELITSRFQIRTRETQVD